MKPAVRQLLLGESAGANFVLNGVSRVKYRSALSKVRAGQRARLLMLGDSTTAGAGTGTNSGGLSRMVGARALSYPTRLAAALTALGIPAYNEAIFGDQNAGGAGETYNAYDPRVNVGAFTLQDIDSIGGSAWTTNLSGVTMAFTPLMTFDRFDVYTVQNAGLGTFTVNVDGGATLATITGAGAAAVIKTTVSCARGLHTINIATTLAAQVYLLGVVPWDSTVGGLDIIQGAHWGGFMSSISATANVWNASNANLLSAIAPDLAILQMSINDTNGGTAAGTYATHLATVDTALEAVGCETLLMAGLPSNNVSESNGQLGAIVNEVRTRAESRSRAYASLVGRYGSYALLNAKGWMPDSVHGNSLLYQDEADWLASNIVKLGAS